VSEQYRSRGYGLIEDVCLFFSLIEIQKNGKSIFQHGNRSIVPKEERIYMGKFIFRPHHIMNRRKVNVDARGIILAHGKGTFLYKEIKRLTIIPNIYIL